MHFFVWMKDTWYIFILDILLSALKGCSQVPKGVTCQAFNCALVQCHLTPDPALVTFHPWKRELWPSEEWPLILTGPNGAWRTASDRRQMETQHACKDRRTCAGGQRDTLMEWTGLVWRPEEWWENRGDRPRQGSAYTGNCWDMQVMSVSMFIDPADTEEEASACIRYEQTGLLLAKWRPIIFISWFKNGWNIYCFSQRWQSSTLRSAWILCMYIPPPTLIDSCEG